MAEKGFLRGDVVSFKTVMEPGPAVGGRMEGPWVGQVRHARGELTIACEDPEFVERMRQVVWDAGGPDFVGEGGSYNYCILDPDAEGSEVKLLEPAPASAEYARRHAARLAATPLDER